LNRLYLVVEGATEEQFGRRVLAPHFAEGGIDVRPMQVRRGGGARGGGRSWQPWERHLVVLMREQRGPDVRVSMMLDLYRVPRDTPGFDATLSGPRLADRILPALAERLADHRFMPYLQVHEFEALVFAALEHLSLVTADPRPRLALAAEASAFASPEAIDDGPETAPSRRLRRHLAGYDKVAHGPDVAAAGGLAVLRARCPRFGAWVERLERAFG